MAIRGLRGLLHAQICERNRGRWLTWHHPRTIRVNHTTTFGYGTTLTVDDQGQPLTIKDPLNNITTFTYNLGDLISVKDPLNRERKRMLDAAGRLRSVIILLGR